MEQVVLPNIRKIFIPDTGWVIWDCDLSGADAQVVAWEAEDDDLKAAFRAGLDVHTKNATDMWGAAFTTLAGDKHGGPKKKKRQSCKHAVHATNYLATPRTMAAHPSINWTVHEADQFQKRWFSIHPKIGPVTRPGTWHYRIQADLDRNKTVSNKFGYRRIYFDRPDAVLPEAVSWVPQSTVGLVSFYGALQLEAAAPWVEMLLQNHDSIVFQTQARDAKRLSEVRAALKVTIPYDDPLTIPWGISQSATSWGDVAEVK